MSKITSKIKSFFANTLAFWIVATSIATCVVFLCIGTQSENGSITLDGKDAVISENIAHKMESIEDAFYRLMNEDAPTDEETIKANEEPTGQGAYTTIDQVIARRKPDGDNDGGRGWQCSKYTAYLATGKKDYSSAHPDYGPVNGKDVAAYLVKNYGWKYVDTPVYGAIGSGGFNTKYGHTAMFLYFTGTNTAMVNDANYVPLTVATHNMNISGWVWVVPGDYTPTPQPTPAPTPTPAPVSDCKVWYVKRGDTMSSIMRTCEGVVDWSRMNAYADSWISRNVKPGQSVYEGWNSKTGVGLYAGDTIERNQ